MITINQTTESITGWINSSQTLEQLQLLRKVVREFVYERFKETVGEAAAQVEAELLLVAINDLEMSMHPLKERLAVQVSEHITTESTFI